jgi:NAD(P)-dependent dehydrogenase (short-subunit alcohol dehydrogenase family)
MTSKPSAIITGAGRGIGRATAIRLAADGYRLALVARSEPQLKETAKLCGGSVFAADVCDRAAVEGVVQRAVEQFGQVDCLVHSAGVAPMQSFEQTTPEIWRSIIDTNLSAAYYFCRALWPVWRRQGGGTAVLVSSVAARDPFKGFAAYAAAKAGVNMLGFALAREGAELGVRVHTVAPGAVETDMLRQHFSDKVIPKEAALDPQDVAAVIGQCVRGELRYTSGEVIYVHKTT